MCPSLLDRSVKLINIFIQQSPRIRRQQSAALAKSRHSARLRRRQLLHTLPPRRAARLLASARRGASLPRPNLVAAAARFLLQRDPQPACGSRYHLCAVHPASAGDPPKGGCDARLFTPLWDDHEARSPTARRLVPAHRGAFGSVPQRWWCSAGSEFDGGRSCNWIVFDGFVNGDVCFVTAAGELRLRGDSSLWMGLPRVLHPCAVQQLEGKVCPVYLLPGESALTSPSTVQ